jgi:ADP-ribose pyrophosphatase YjhB (NUDIX family)
MRCVAHWVLAAHSTTTLNAMYQARRILFCRACGSPAAYVVPKDDNRERATCTACGEIHYENPLNVVGTVPVWQQRVLLCRRNIEPRFGYWTLPAGFMEQGESTAEGALRETVEESGAQVELQGLFTLLNVPRVSQVHLYYRAKMLNEQLNPGPETIEARLFSEHEVPWTDLAFQTVRQTLEHFFADQRAGVFGVHVGDVA